MNLAQYKMQTGGPRILPRFSSRRSEFEGQKRKLEEEIEEMKKRIKMRPSFDKSVWSGVTDVEAARIEASKLQRKISMLSMNLDDEDENSVKQWASTDDGQGIMVKEKLLKTNYDLLSQQVEKVINQSKEKDFNVRQSFTQLFISAKLGFGLNKQSKTRSSERQKQFRDELIRLMDPIHPGQDSSHFWWCPVMGDWCNKVTAGHLFPSKSGDELMKAFFGEADQDMWIDRPERGKSELFRACNGILWSEQVEHRFSKGLFTIVPDLDEDPTPAEAEAWQQSKPKEYRVRVLQPNHKDMRAYVKPDGDMRYADLDNKRLQWRTDFRPRARYLYWSYCEMMLRDTYLSDSSTSQADSRRREVGKKYWGSGGPYIKRNMLLGFVEEMGHEYEHLLDGAMDVRADDGEESTTVAVMHANESIVEKQETIENYDPEAESDDDDDDDDDGL